ncbi:hypothetical protein SUGI_0229580, partial [Cryptomeria japonica]
MTSKSDGAHMAPSPPASSQPILQNKKSFSGVVSKASSDVLESAKLVAANGDGALPEARSVQRAAGKRGRRETKIHRMMALLASLRRTGGIGFKRGGLSTREIQSFSLPELPYEYSALERLSALEEASANKDAEAIVSLQSAIKFNGGDFAVGNHSLLLLLEVAKLNIK